MLKSATEKKAGGGTDRNRNIKNGEGASALRTGKIIGQQGWRDRRIGCLADSYPGARDQELSKIACQPGGCSCNAPGAHTSSHQTRPREAITKNTEDRRRHEVRDQKCVRQEAKLEVGQHQFRLNARQNGGKNKAIDVIEKIQQRDQRERVVTHPHQRKAGDWLFRFTMFSGVR